MLLPSRILVSCLLASSAFLSGAADQAIGQTPVLGQTLTRKQLSCPFSRPDQFLVPSGVESGDLFGRSTTVSYINGLIDIAVVGAPGDDDGATNAGAAYVFTRGSGTWQLAQKILPPDAHANGRFGSSLDSAGLSLVVGSTSGQGGVYVYSFDAGSEQFVHRSKIDAVPGVEFASSIAISGASQGSSAELLAVGAPIDDEVGFDAGAVFVFGDPDGDRTYTFLYKLLPSGDAVGGFGSTVALDGSLLVAGAPFGGANPLGGAAQAFRVSQSGASLIQTLTENYSSNSGYGEALSLHGGRLVLGVKEEGASLGSGRALVYRDTGQGLAFEAELSPPSSLGRVGFGRTVSIHGDQIVVEAPGMQPELRVFERLPGGWAEVASLLAPDLAFQPAIQAYEGDVFAPTSSSTSDAAVAFFSRAREAAWTLAASLEASPIAPNDYVGRDFAMSGDVAVMGAYQDSTLADSNGAVHVFRRTSEGWEQSQKLFAPDASAGALFGYSVDVSGDTIVATALYEGAAYIFSRIGDAYFFEEKIFISNSVLASNVAIDGGRLAVLSYPGGTTLELWMYRRSFLQWDLVDVISRPDPGFGFTLEMDGRTLAASVPNHTSQGVTGAGGVYIFEDQGLWVETAFLVDPTPRFNANFGAAISIDGGQIAIGAPRDAQLTRRNGSVSIFDRDVNGDWSFEQQIALFESQSAYEFLRLGSSVHLDGHRLFVGAPGALGGANLGPGGIFEFRRRNGRWPEISSGSFLVSPNPMPGVDFGAFLGGSDGVIGIVTANGSSVVGNGTLTFIEFGGGSCF
ncbi:MAG: hypothetical protein AAGG01_14820 [Planctomycetota bacterium]